MKKPIIHAYFICHNEEYIMPHLLRYYSDFCEKIYIIDNMSDDNTRDIVNSFDNTEIIDYNSKGKFDDNKHMNLKNNVWKISEGIADYVILGDSDEFLYNENMEEFLTRVFEQGYTFFKPHGSHMIADENLILKSDDDLLSIVKYGVPTNVLNKPMMFNCNKIKEINYSLGAHMANPIGEVKMYHEEDLKMLHYKYIGLENHLRRCKSRGSRLSDFNLRTGVGRFYLFTDNENIKDYRNYLNKRIKIIN
jgi:hypothetical protein